MKEASCSLPRGKGNSKDAYPTCFYFFAHFSYPWIEAVVCVCVCVCLRLDTCTCVCVYIYIYICMYVCMYVCICMYVYLREGNMRNSIGAYPTAILIMIEGHETAFNGF